MAGSAKCAYFPLRLGSLVKRGNDEEGNDYKYNNGQSVILQSTVYTNPLLSPKIMHLLRDVVYSLLLCSFCSPLSMD